MTMKIYTRTGDDGTTALFGGTRLRKDAVRIEAYGSVDELNSVLGLARATSRDARITAMIARVQNELFTLGSDLATPLDEAKVQVPRITDTHVAWLEAAIDELEGTLAPITYFILPGGSETAARLHLARTVCRRAERITVHLASMDAITPADVRYLNRLSDFLFVLARAANAADDTAEIRWEKE